MVAKKKKKVVKKKVTDKKVTSEKPLKINLDFNEALKKIFNK